MINDDMLSYSNELKELVTLVNTVPDSKNYWLIRTQGGSLYDSFIDYGIVGMGHTYLSLHDLHHISALQQKDSIIRKIREKVSFYYKAQNKINKGEEFKTEREITFVANQIYTFYFEVKRGDIVIIPSENSLSISFGEIKESFIGDFSKVKLSKQVNDLILKKRVNWIKTSERSRIDPYLYKMFNAHQAIVDVRAYAEYIERAINDIFILEDEAHFVISIDSQNRISANSLFGMGHCLLKLVDDFSASYNLGLCSEDLAVTLYLNSPGKSNLKSKIKETTVLAALILLMAGGGYESKNGISLKTPGMPGILNAISDFMDRKQNREMAREVFAQYKDSLKVKNPDDIVKLLKQFSDNKDKSK